MAKTTIAKATFFTTTIEVPVKAIMLNNEIKDLDVLELEEYFEDLIQSIDPHDYLPNRKSDYEKCRILTKWAYNCNASLENYSNSLDAKGNKVIKFSFGFVDMDEMQYFVNGLNILK